MNKKPIEAHGWLNDKGSFIRNNDGEDHSYAYKRLTKSKSRNHEKLVKDAINKGWTRLYIYKNLLDKKADGVLQYKKDKWTPRHEKSLKRISRAIGATEGDKTERIEEATKDSTSHKFVNDMYDRHPTNPFNHREFVIPHEKGHAMFHVSPMGDDTVHIHDFRTHPQKSGIGTQALKDLLGHAQRHGVKLHLHPEGYANTSTRVLKKFYKKHGFKGDSYEMTWTPDKDIKESKSDDASIYGWLNSKGSYIRNRKGDNHVATLNRFGVKSKGGGYMAHDNTVKHAIEKKGWSRLTIEKDTDGSAMGSVERGKWSSRHDKAMSRLHKAFRTKNNNANSITHSRGKADPDGEYEEMKEAKEDKYVVRSGTKHYAHHTGYFPNGQKSYKWLPEVEGAHVMSKSEANSMVRYGKSNGQTHNIISVDKLNEEIAAPTNCVGAGAVAGIGFGPQGEPGRKAMLMPLARRRADVLKKVMTKKKWPKLTDDPNDET